MSWEFCTETIQKARKDYHCSASDWIDESGMCEEDFDEEDWLTVQKAWDEEYKILKGTEYIKVVGRWEGEFNVFRARNDLDEICKKYELYES